MPILKMQIIVDHPILFLLDASDGVELPDELGGFVAAARSCICVNVLAHVDGASLVTVTDQLCSTGGLKLFDGGIEVPTGVLSIADSAGFRYINVPVPIGRVTVTIWADDEINPEWVWIRLGAFRDF